MGLQITLSNGVQCGTVVDLFYTYNSLDSVTCDSDNYVKTCDLINPETDDTTFRIICTCTEQCFGAIILSNFNQFTTLQICDVLLQ